MRPATMSRSDAIPGAKDARSHRVGRRGPLRSRREARRTDCVRGGDGSGGRERPVFRFSQGKCSATRKEVRNACRRVDEGAGAGPDRRQAAEVPGSGPIPDAVAPWRKVEVKRLDTDALVADLRAEELALVPAEDLRVIALGPYERALVTRRGKPARWLGAGVQQVWTVDRPARDGAP